MGEPKLIKVNISERDGQELEFTEEISPYNDMLQSAGIQIDPILRTRIISATVGEDIEDRFGGLQSVGIMPKRLYTRDLEFENGWWMIQTHCQDFIHNRVRVPTDGQYPIEGGKLKIKKGGALWLERGAKLIVRKRNG